MAVDIACGEGGFGGERGPYAIDVPDAPRGADVMPVRTEWAQFSDVTCLGWRCAVPQHN
jgi:hypothetical protein